MAYIKQVWKNSPSEESPLTSSRLNHLETQYDNAVKYTDDRIRDLPPPEISGLEVGTGTVTLKKTPTGKWMEVAVLDPLQVGQWQIESSSSNLPVSGARSAGELSRSEGFSSLFAGNATTPVVSGTYRIVGLNIHQGEPIQDFGVSATGSLKGADLEALILTRFGKLLPARKSDNLSAREYVSRFDAVESFGYGPIVVEGGVDTEWWKDSRFSGFTGELSARTMLGQRPDGKIVLISVHGKTGVDGITGKEISDVCILEGCDLAVNLDGGGTTQVTWDGQVVHPSSDTAQERKLASAVTFKGTVLPFDSGFISLPTAPGVTPSESGVPALSGRRVGGDVKLYFACQVPPAQNAWISVTDSPPPSFLQPIHPRYARGVVSAPAGNFGVISYSDDHTFSARNNSASITFLAGELHYSGRGSF